MASLIDLLYSGVWKGEGVDKIWWKPSAWGTLDVRSFYKALEIPFSYSFSVEDCVELQSAFKD